MKNEKGMVSLEACITVLFFMVVMFLLSGLFLMYMAQNATAHALLQTSQSLALDNYAAEKIGTGSDMSSFKDLMVALVGDGLNLIPEKNSAFATNLKLSDLTETSTAETKTIPELAKERFVAYITGGDKGNFATLNEKADDMLKNLKVEKGLEGLDFSESKVEGNDLKIIVTYQLNYIFQIAELGKIDVRQETSSKLWS